MKWPSIKHSFDEWVKWKIAEFTRAGSIGGGFEFWPSDTEKNSKRLYYWKYKCPKCSNDEFVDAGLCDGIFESAEATLRKGQLSCRCSKAFRWTKDQREFVINKILKERGDGVEFVRWRDGYHGALSKMVLKCVKNYEWTISIGNFMNGAGCPCCSTTGFKANNPGALYVIRAVNNVTGESFTGYGISGCVDHRIRQHKCSLRKKGFVMTEMEFFHFNTGSMALSMEREIRKNFYKSGINVKGFIEESTSYHNYDDLISFVEEKIAYSLCS
jgi:hypothetical protein